MKRNAFVRGTESVLLSLACGWSSAAVLVTGFQLPMALSWELCALLCAWSLLCTGLLMGRKTAWVIPVLCTAVTVGLWYFGNLKEQTISLLASLVRIYDAGYGIGIPRLLQVEQIAQDQPLGILVMIVIACVCRTVCRGRGNQLSILAVTAPFVCCLPVKETVPSVPALFGLLLCLMLLLLTDSVRTEQDGQGTRLVFTALIPAALVLGLLFYLTPKDSYVNQTGEIREKMVNWVMELPQKIQEARLKLPSFRNDKERVELSTLGAQPQMGLPIAEVTAQHSGILYLRMQDFDQYTGTRWETDGDRMETMSGTGKSLGQVNIRTLLPMGSYLLPSFPAGETILCGGKVINEEEKIAYTFGQTESFLSAFPADSMLSLPASTWDWTQAVLQELPQSSATVDGIAGAIREYVRRSAVYDRQASVMASGSTDFVRWFLEDADRGYCTHFASSAVVLLRGAGIPARYVTGYRIEVQAGVPTRVTSNDAHAWAEYYNYGNWTWTILEATPPDPNLMPEPMEPQTEPTWQTQPTETTVPETTRATETVTEPQTIPPVATETIPRLGEEKVYEPIVLSPTLIWVLSAVGVVLLLEVQRWIRMRFRKARQSRGSINTRAIACWEEIRQLNRLAGQTPPEELRILAEKAAFSRHGLTKDELTDFLTGITAGRIALQSKPWWKRLVCRIWYAEL